MNRSEIRARLRETLPDQSTWSDARLNAWIGAAVQAYSTRFPRQASATLACETGVQEYSLLGLAGLHNVLQVAYPASGESHRLLRWTDMSNFAGLPVYALRGEPPHTLLLGPQVQDGESVAVIYLADYAQPESDQDDLGLPAEAAELIHLFILVQAALALEMQAASEPPGSALPASPSRSLQQAYHAAVESHYRRQAPGGFAGPWKRIES